MLLFILVSVSSFKGISHVTNSEKITDSEVGPSEGRVVPTDSIRYDKTTFSKQIQEKVDKIYGNIPYNIRGANIFADEYMRELYRRNKGTPLWKNETMYKDFIAALDNVYTDGLIAEDYNASLIKELFSKVTSSDTIDHELLTDLELITTNAYLLLGLHLFEGKLEPGLVDPNWNYELYRINEETPDIVYGHFMKGTPTDYLEEIRSDSNYYLWTRETLAEYYELQKRGGWEPIPVAGITKIEVGDTSDAIPLIRKRLAMTDNVVESVDGDPKFYDKDLEIAVKAFQLRHGLNEDGIIGKGTLGALNIPVEDKINTLRVNLERLRWLSDSRIQKRIIVNIAEYHAALIKGNLVKGREENLLHGGKVMVGRPYTKTPVFESKLSYIELNPTWTVPRSIIIKEMLPKMRKDPNYLSDRNMKLLTFEGTEVPVSSVDLDAENFPYMIRQGPGPGNALGRVKFIFPNRFSVFLHDTPSKSLFSREARAFSHGCIRLQDPLYWTELLMNDPEWNAERINTIVRSGKTTRIVPKEDINVMVVYLTGYKDNTSAIKFYQDIYKRDGKVLALLDGPMDKRMFLRKRERLPELQTKD